MARFSMKRVIACAATILVVTPLLATPADTVKSRVAGLRELGAAFKGLKDGLNSSDPQTILIQQSARQVRNAAAQMPSWFPAGTGSQPGVKTSAKPEIWTQAEKFKSSQATFAAEASKFQMIVNSGNVAAMRAEFPKLGATCKGCHDSFRVPST